MRVANSRGFNGPHKAAPLLVDLPEPRVLGPQRRVGLATALGLILSLQQRRTKARHLLLGRNAALDLGTQLLVRIARVEKLKEKKKKQKQKHNQNA